MKRKSTALTKEERDVLIVAAVHPNGEYLNNSEIAQRLGLHVSRVKTLIHKACIKLKAQSRYEAIYFAVTRGEIKLTELFSLDELTEVLSSLSPDMLRGIADFVRQEPEHGHLLGKDERIICTDRRQDTTLTKSERDVLILTSYGLTNGEIAERLCISVSTVRTFLYRACIKLGARKRADALLVALKQRYIVVDDIFSFNELIQYLAPLGPESVEKIAGLLSEKLGQEPTPTFKPYNCGVSAIFRMKSSQKEVISAESTEKIDGLPSQKLEQEPVLTSSPYKCAFFPISRTEPYQMN